MRKTIFSVGEFYHVYNRGVDKRTVFEDVFDVQRFLQSMREFNTAEPIGSIYEHSFLQLGGRASKLAGALPKKPLVNFICYCLNPNHYHFILEEITEKGIQRFMHRLATGYTMYFNERYKRSGALFQGKFKASHVDSNEYLLHLSAYVNLNWRVHQLGGSASKLVRRSWGEYTGKRKRANDTDFCKKGIILEQFGSVKKYEKFALDALSKIQERKGELKEIEFTA